ncbi:2-succinylbenzoate--CoA ligase [Planktothrix paucivesiculata]|uniref:O-succinylbenzoic acid--CoA ligase n=1 Tax=Planktothrix paucivesiculata PCC 9631 TaxID=671071 RepID=A0A7Z9BYD2_9CYAN|nr:2-succinylbenzoate--CoA ligase [Planktothrix paucivesiculata]VXD22259.1 O-succinylbenzoic acid--CoA ligase [Planktothrix paucivesiculata PCC 9631]
MNLIDEIPNRLTSNNTDSLIDCSNTQLQIIDQWINSNKNYPKILISESDPILFLSAFVAAVTVKCPFFLCNPQWGEQEWKQVNELVKPNLLISQGKILDYQNPSNHHEILENLIMIPTGGTSGKIKFTVHDLDSLTASVQGVQKYFQTPNINCFCTLPLYHVSGFMQWMRSLLTNGQLIITSFKTVEAEEWINFNPANYFISLVPTQLHRLLQYPSLTHWLSKFQIVLLGGAPPWLELLEQSRFYQIPLALTYGMTETASQIVSLKPSDFLGGNNSCGNVLPHAEIKIYDQNGEELKANQSGIIRIKSDSLMLGYYQDNFDPQLRINCFTPDDLGYWDEQGYLTLVGRQSNKIITGGENVFPAEVEAVILSTGLVKDICVLGKPDQYWGEIVVAVYVANYKQVSEVELEQAILGKLSKFKHPKLWIPVEQLPRNSQGKINQKQIKQLVSSSLSESDRTAV